METVNKIEAFGCQFIIVVVILAAMTCFPAKAETGKSDSPILFKFIPEKDQFYSPFANNDKSIIQGARLIEKNRKLIEAGKAWVVVRGFCCSQPTFSENMQTAKIRSNRVKSWFITHHGMKEDYYITGNSTRPYNGMKDVVAIMNIRYAPGYSPKELEMKRIASERDSINEIMRERELEMRKMEELRRSEAVRTGMSGNLKGVYLGNTGYRCYVNTPWYIKSNLAYDAILMPSLEIEYRFGKNWSAAVEGNMAWWHKNSTHKYYQLATIVPELKWWFLPQGNRKGHYVGVFGGGGWYDLENGGTGYKGTGGYAGISYGYMFPVGKHLSFEVAAGVGYLTTKYEEYYPDGGHYVYKQKSEAKFIGPVKLKFALVWNIGRWVTKGGAR